MGNPARNPLCSLVFLLLALGCTSKRDHDASAKDPEPEPDAGVTLADAASPAFRTNVAPAQPTTPRCREQPAQDFLLRKDQLAKVGASAAERQAIMAARQKSIDYRTREYGHFPGFGNASDNPFPPNHYAKRTTFMGQPLVVHEKIVPALSCVEKALARDCASNPYRPRQVSGLRLKNTYQDYEVSNHVYGIAIDIDSRQNPCCHCVGEWSQNPICEKKVDSVFERMAMPRCWVEVFERYGFHWLGHDELEDTMHFEFLGDPERIME